MTCAGEQGQMLPQTQFLKKTQQHQEYESNIITDVEVIFRMIREHYFFWLFSIVQCSIYRKVLKTEICFSMNFSKANIYVAII